MNLVGSLHGPAFAIEAQDFSVTEIVEKTLGFASCEQAETGEVSTGITSLTPLE